MPEALDGGTEIRAAVLRDRLEDVVRIVRQRQALVYNRNQDDAETAAAVQSYIDFVELCERKETATGTPCRIEIRR